PLRARDRPLPVPHHQHPPLAAALPPGLERVQAGLGGRRARVGVHGALRHRAARCGARRPPGRVPHPRRRGCARRREGARPRARGEGAVAGGAALPERPAGGEGSEGDLPPRTLPGRRRGILVSFSVWLTGPDLPAIEATADAIARRLSAREVAVEVLDFRSPGVDALAGDGVECRAAFVAEALARHGVATVVALPVPTRAARARARDDGARLSEAYVCTGYSPSERYEVPDRLEVEIADEAGVER